MRTPVHSKLWDNFVWLVKRAHHCHNDDGLSQDHLMANRAQYEDGVIKSISQRATSATELKRKSKRLGLITCEQWAKRISRRDDLKLASYEIVS